MLYRPTAFFPRTLGGLRLLLTRPLVRLSYGRMVFMALPYTLVLGGVGLIAVTWWL